MPELNGFDMQINLHFYSSMKLNKDKNMGIFFIYHSFMRIFRFFRWRTVPPNRSFSPNQSFYLFQSCTHIFLPSILPSVCYFVIKPIDTIHYTTTRLGSNQTGWKTSTKVIKLLFSLLFCVDSDFAYGQIVRQHV